MFRQISAVIVLVGLGATACGDDSAAVPLAAPGPTTVSPGPTEPSPPPTAPVEMTPSTPATSGTEPSNVAGFGEPAQYPGEFPTSGGFALTGTVRQLGNGCFMLEVRNELRVVAFPEGYIADPADPSNVIGPDGWRIVDGTAIDGAGRNLPVDTISGGRDSRWGNQLDYCDPGAIDLMVLDTAAPSFDPAALTPDELVGLLDDAEFTESWPCGYGFATSTADQHVGLRIYALTEPSGPATVALPDAGWNAQVIVGKNLFSQNCDDVVEFWEPDAIIDASWPLTAGTFEFDAPAGPTTGCSSNVIATTLAGAVADAPSGPISLPDLELVNAAWGCFAG